jgi:hypothetical protein
MLASLQETCKKLYSLIFGHIEYIICYIPRQKYVKYLLIEYEEEQFLKKLKEFSNKLYGMQCTRDRIEFIDKIFKYIYKTKYMMPFMGNLNCVMIEKMEEIKNEDDNDAKDMMKKHDYLLKYLITITQKISII